MGGAARSRAVQEIAPAVLGRPVVVPEPGEAVADGAARQAAWVTRRPAARLGRGRQPHRRDRPDPARAGALRRGARPHRPLNPSNNFRCFRESICKLRDDDLGGPPPVPTTPVQDPAQDRAPGPIRLSDVARATGVSIATVSKALGSGQDISAATRARVRAMAEEMGYRPQGGPRRPRTGSTRTVGLLTSDSVGRFSTPVLLGAGDAVGAESMSVVLCDSRGDDIRKRHHLQTLLDHGIDGLIALARDHRRPTLARRPRRPRGIRLRRLDLPRRLLRRADEDAGAVTAVEHLLALGRRRIAHVTGPDDFAATRRRATAVTRVLAGHDLALSGRSPLTGDWTEQWGRVAAEMVLRQTPTSTRSSAATTTSPAASATPCATAACASRRTSPWSATTTGGHHRGGPPAADQHRPQPRGGRPDRGPGAVRGDQRLPPARVQRLPCRLVLRESTLGGG